MKKIKEKRAIQARRQAKVRAKISGTKERPRLSVFRSNRGMYLQLIDDSKGQTLLSAHSLEIKEKLANKTELASALGKLLAEKALAKNYKEIVFDRRSYKYHGRVKALAEAAREAGLIF